MLKRKNIISSGVLSLACALLSTAPALGQSDEANPVFMTGVEPIDGSEYDTLPKVGQFRAFLPLQVDLTPLFPKPGYQGAQPNCVAWATTYAAHSFLVAESVVGGSSSAADPMSPAYVYNRLRKPGSACDRSIRIVDALRLLQTEGTVTLAEFPDEISRCAIPAPEALIGKAKANRLSEWRAINRSRGTGGSKVVLDDIKGALSRAEPVVFAMPAMPDFKALKNDSVYRHSTPESTNWHAMAVIGYDESRQAFRIVNSWGSHWGDAGYAWIDYATFGLLVGEAYAMKMQRQPEVVPLAKFTSAKAEIDPRLAFVAKAAALTCGKVDASSSGGRLVITGFGGNADELAELRRAAIAMDDRADWRVKQHDWPQCEAELTLDRALAEGGVTASVLTERGKPRSGDPVTMTAGNIFSITSAGSPERPWLSIVYLQADGSAVELFEGDTKGKRVTIGLGGKQETRFQVGPPFGHEMIIALASAKPIFASRTDAFTTERQYLTNLRSVIANRPAGEIAASTIRLQTAP